MDRFKICDQKVKSLQIDTFYWDIYQRSTGQIHSKTYKFSQKVFRSSFYNHTLPVYQISRLQLKNFLRYLAHKVFILNQIASYQDPSLKFCSQSNKHALKNGKVGKGHFEKAISVTKNQQILPKVNQVIFKYPASIPKYTNVDSITTYIATDKRGHPHNIFLISRQIHMLL